MEPPSGHQKWSRKEFYSTFSSGDLGLQSILSHLLSETLVYVIETQETYLYDSETRLWEVKTEKEMPTYCAKILVDTIKPLLSVKLYEATLLPIHGKLTSVKSCVKLWDEVKYSFKRANFKSKLNAAPYLIPMADGTVVDILTMKVRDRRPDDLFTKAYPCVLLPESASVIEIEKFALELSNGDAELAVFLSKYVGYKLSGLTNWKSIFILSGKSNGGKTSLLKLMQAMMGDFWSTVNSSVVLATSQSKENPTGPTPQFLPLQSCRAVFYSEPAVGSRLNAATLKAISGDGTHIRCRLPYSRQEFSFAPIAKASIDSNPVLITDDEALLRRLLIIPFLAAFVFEPKGPHEYLADPDRIAKLINEHLNEAFTWAIRGIHSMLSSGKGLQAHLPKVVRTATARYQQLQIPDECYINECIELIDEQDDELLSEKTLLRHFNKWCRTNGLPVNDKTYQTNLINRLIEVTDRVVTVGRNKQERERLFGVRIKV